MLAIKRILFPTDYSTCAEHAFSHAVRLAERYGADVHVLHVKEDISRGVPAGPDYRGPVPLQNTVVSHESTPEAILAFAEDRDVDLIVLGTHGRRPLERLIMGSVAERVVRLASCPVLTVHARAEDSLERTRRILVPIDFSEHANVALAYAAELSHVYGADIDLLHVVPDDALPYVYGVEPVSTGAAALTERAHAALSELAAQIDARGRQVTLHSFIGHPARDIVGFASEQHDGMIVIATHGLSNLERFFLGGVADRVVRKAPCPVFTVKSFGKRLLDPSVPVPRLSHLPSTP